MKQNKCKLEFKYIKFILHGCKVYLKLLIRWIISIQRKQNVYYESQKW